MPDDGGPERAEAGRAAARVDVDPVRLDADGDDVGTDALKQSRREPVRCPVRAVGNHPPAGERLVDARMRIAEVLLFVGRHAYRAEQMREIAFGFVRPFPYPAEAGRWHAP